MYYYVLWYANSFFVYLQLFEIQHIFLRLSQATYFRNQQKKMKTFYVHQFYRGGKNQPREIRGQFYKPWCISKKVLNMLLIYSYICPWANEHSSKTHAALYYEVSTKCCVSISLHLAPNQSKHFTKLIPGNQCLTWSTFI